MNTKVPERQLAILGFHKIGPFPNEWETWFYVPTATFVGFLRYLRENDWRAISLAMLLQGLAEPERLPRRAALLTFDDGYRSLLSHGLPELAQFGCPAVVFVPTAFIGGTNQFDADNEPEEAICDWDDLRALDRGGVAVQSHGVRHRAFSELSLAECELELRRSKGLLEDELGKPVEMFSFPYGDEGTDAGQSRRLLEQAGYRAACLYGGGPNPWPASSPFRLARLAMGPDTDLRAELNAVSDPA